MIRALQPNEWRAYKRLRLEALEREPQAFGATYASTIQKPDDFWRKRLEDAEAMPDSPILFAVRDGVPIGLAAACPGETVGQVAIISVYVTAAERGRGVARALMTALLQALQSRAETVSLHVNPDQSAALTLYLSLGFTVQEEITAVLGDGIEHREYRMEKALR